MQKWMGKSLKIVHLSEEMIYALLFSEILALNLLSDCGFIPK
jgi:hypothetical protein